MEKGIDGSEIQGDEEEYRQRQELDAPRLPKFKLPKREKRPLSDPNDPMLPMYDVATDAPEA